MFRELIKINNYYSINIYHYLKRFISINLIYELKK